MGIVESQLLFNQEGDHFPVCLARHLHFSSLGWPTYHARLRLTPQPPLMLKLIPGMDTVDTMDTDHMDTIDPTVTDTRVERRGKLSPPLMLMLIPGMDTMAVTTDTDPTTDTTDTDTDTGAERRVADAVADATADAEADPWYGYYGGYYGYRRPYGYYRPYGYAYWG